MVLHPDVLAPRARLGVRTSAARAAARATAGGTHLGRAPAGRAQPGRAHVAGQGGFSLLEVLVSILLISTVIMSIAAGMLTLMRLTQHSSQSQRLQVALTSFTESLAAVPYLACPSAASTAPNAAHYQAAYDALGGEWNRVGDPSGTITGVEYWQDDAAPVAVADRFGDYVGTCPANDRGRQRLTVRVRDADGTTRTGQIVISAAVGP